MAILNLWFGWRSNYIQISKVQIQCRLFIWAMAIGAKLAGSKKTLICNIIGFFLQMELLSQFLRPFRICNLIKICQIEYNLSFEFIFCVKVRLLDPSWSTILSSHFPLINFLISFSKVSWGGHSIVKLNTMCKQNLLPLYYMPKINFKFRIFFAYTKSLIVCFVYFFENFSHLYFCGNIFVQFWSSYFWKYVLF